MLGDETITLHYEEDLDDLATVSTDRAGVPIGGQVHVTISDFRLNLDPTAADVWYMNASSSSATYGTTEGTAATVDTAASIATPFPTPPKHPPITLTGMLSSEGKAESLPLPTQWRQFQT